MKEKLISLGSKSFLKPYFLGLLSALFFTLSFPKGDYSLLIFIALVPLFWASSEKEGDNLTILSLGLFFGLIHYLSLLYWIAYTLHKYGFLPWVVAIFVLFLLSLYLALYPALFLLLNAQLKVFSEPTPAKGLFLSMSFVGFEFLRSTLLTGFPWGLAGYPLANFSPLLQSADLLGIWGLSFLVLFINYYLFYTLKSFSSRAIKRFASLRSQLFFLSIILFFLFYGYYQQETWEKKLMKRGDSLKVALLQGNIPQEIKEAKEIKISIETYERLLWMALSHNPDLILFPETAFPFYFPHDREPSLKLLEILERLRLTGRDSFHRVPVLIFGTFRVSNFNSSPRVHNSLLVWDGKDIADLYDKEKLVPFGEYVPLARFFPFLKRISVVSDIIKPGISKNLSFPIGENHFELVPLICFESAFPQIWVKRLRKGGDFLFIATNDAWFGKTSAPYQHFQLAIVRAVEGRRYVLQAANTGISGVINPLGQVEVKSFLEREEIILGTIRPLKDKTPFVRGGYLFPYLATFLLLASVVYIIWGNYLRGRRRYPWLKR